MVTDDALITVFKNEKQLAQLTSVVQLFNTH